MTRYIYSAYWCNNKECDKHCARHPRYGKGKGAVDGNPNKGRCPDYLPICQLSAAQKKEMGVW